jgi:transcriptional regulator of heat shock response
MMLTARQEKLLRSVIEEFIKTAQAVGSTKVSDDYDLEVSPATIRNEMAHLSELGLLAKPHASSGRVPTSRALKWFLEQVREDMEDIEVMHVADVREAMFQKRFDSDKLLNEAVSALHKLTRNTAVAIVNQRRYTAGISKFLGQPEYEDLQRLKKILEVLEDYNQLLDLFNSKSGKEVEVLIGEETGIDQFSESAVVFTQIKIHGNSEGYLGVVGPNRMDYRKIIPALKYISKNIQEVVSGW